MIYLLLVAAVITHIFRSFMQRSTFINSAIVCLAIVILLGLFYLPYWSVRNKTIDSYESEQRSLAGHSIRQIESFFDTYGKALEYFSTQPSVINLDEGGRALMEDFLAIHAGELSAVTRIDAEGTIIFTAPEVAGIEGMDSGVRERLQPLLLQRVPTISRPFITPQGVHAFSWAYPVFQGEEFKGAVSFLIPYADIARKFISQIKVKENGFILMVDSRGTVLYAPDEQYIGLTVQESFAGDPELLSLGRQMMKPKPGALFLTSSRFLTSGQPSLTRYAVFTPIKLPAGMFWSVAVASPEDDVLAAMQGFRSQWFMVTASALCAVLLLSYLLNKTLARQRSEKSKREAEEQLVRLLDTTPMGMVVYQRKNGSILYFNRTANELLGGDIEALLNHSIFEFVHPGSREFVAGRLANLEQGGRNDAAVAKFVNPTNGEIRDMEVSTARIVFRGEDGFLSVFRDVSEEINREARQRRLVTAIEQAHEAVLITDRESRVEYVNPAFTEVSGYSSEEILGKTPRILRSGKHDERFYREMWQTILSGRVWKGRIINRHKDGTLFTEMATISPVRDSSGEITHFVAVKRDISHEVELEGKLRQAQKMEAIGTLAGGIAHDFNNILGGILGFTDMALLQSDPESPVHDALLNIRKGGKRAADLVQQILTFSRQSSREKKQIRIRSVVLESLQLLRASLPSTISIQQELHAEDALVMADATQLQQIVINLCTNAFQAMREQGGVLRIRLEELPAGDVGMEMQKDADRCVLLEIADSGTGIESSVIDRIFDPFFTTKDPGEGTGLGLSVVHGIIRDLGGDISVDSVTGKGTVFTVLLPAAEPAVEEDQDTLPSLPMGNEHILVVDDEMDILTTSKMMLSHLGYSVTVDQDPAAMLEKIEKGELACDLVVTDQTMPQMTGLDFTRALHHLQPTLPVIVCTGYSDRVNEESVAKAGGAGLLMKPVELRDLAVMIRMALDRGKG